MHSGFHRPVSGFSNSLPGIDRRMHHLSPSPNGRATKKIIVTKVPQSAGLRRFFLLDRSCLKMKIIFSKCTTPLNIKDFFACVIILFFKLERFSPAGSILPLYPDRKTKDDINFFLTSISTTLYIHQCGFLLRTASMKNGKGDRNMATKKKGKKEAKKK